MVFGWASPHHHPPSLQARRKYLWVHGHSEDMRVQVLLRAAMLSRKRSQLRVDQELNIAQAVARTEFSQHQILRDNGPPAYAHTSAAPHSLDRARGVAQLVCAFEVAPGAELDRPFLHQPQSAVEGRPL